MPEDMPGPEFHNPKQPFGPDFNQENPTARFARGGGAGGLSDEELDPRDRALLEQFATDMFFGRRKDGRTPVEILRSSENPQEIALATQRAISSLYSEYVEWSKEPNVYRMEYLLSEVSDRIDYFSEQLPLGEIELPEKWEKLIQEKPQEAEKKLNEIVEAYERAQKRILAEGFVLLPKVVEQRRFGADVEDYAAKYFTYLYKREIPSNTYSIVFNAEATREGYVPLGWQVEDAYDAFRNIGEGKAVASLTNDDLQELGYTGPPLSLGEVKKVRVPNIHGLPANLGLMKFAMKYYVLPELQKARGDKTYPDTIKGRAEKKAEDRNSLQATLAALALWWHADKDMDYSVAKKGTGEWLDPTDLTGVNFDNINLETGPFAIDASKMRHAQLRQAAEHGGVKPGERKEHIRAAGNPMLYPATPNMIASMFDILTSELPTPQKTKDSLIRQFGDRVKIPEKVNLTVNSWKYDNEATVPVEVGGRKKWVKVEKDPVKFRDIPFNDVRVVNLETVENVVDKLKPRSEEYLHFALGPQKNAYEVPYKLQMFYAFGSLYSTFFESNLIKLTNELVSEDKLRSLNKKFDVALALLANAYSLSDSTVQKFGNYLRASLIAATAAGVSSEIAPGANRSQEVSSQTNQYQAEYKTGHLSLNNLLEAARVHTFLPTDKNSNQLDGKWSRYANNVYKRIIKEKKQAPTPKESNLFEEHELQELKPLYPFGGCV